MKIPKPEFLRSNLCSPLLTVTLSQSQPFRRKLKRYSEDKLVPLDLKRNIYRQFESVEENLIKYVNARFIHYKREKFGTSFIFLQGKCKYFKGFAGLDQIRKAFKY